MNDQKNEDCQRGSEQYVDGHRVINLETTFRGTVSPKKIGRMGFTERDDKNRRSIMKRHGL